MKRFYFIAVALVALVVLSSCQKPKEEEITLEVTVENISGSWLETEVLIQGQTHQVAENAVYDFKADGSFHYAGEGEERSGEWKLKDKVITTVYYDATGKLTTVYNVDKLTNRTLVLAWTISGEQYGITCKRK